MAEKILITSDSTTDLSPELLERYHIPVLPLIVSLNDVDHKDGIDITPEEIYHNYETNPVDLEFGTPTVSVLVHNTDFNWWDDTPAMPEPYQTFTDDMGYGPEGYRRPVNYGLDSKEGGNWR